MTSIRRLIPGLTSSIARTLGVGTQKPVDALAPREALDAVEPVRRGFSDQSDFQPDAGGEGSPLAAHLAHLEGRATPGAGGYGSQALRGFSGESSFEAASPRYAQRLGSQLPSSLGAPGERAEGVGGAGGRRGAGAADPSDILSPEDAAWELQNLDTSTPTISEPEDLLFMLDPPGSSGPVPPELQLNMEDVFEDGPQAVGGTGDVDSRPADPYANPLDPAYAAAHGAYAVQFQPSVNPAGPDEFLADTNDLGAVGGEEPTPNDAAMASVLGALAANPAAASVQVSAALASRAVEKVADTVAPQADTLKAGETGLAGQPPPSTPKPLQPGITDTFVAAAPSGPALTPEG